MNNIFFSVVIPLYNKQNVIVKTLQSVMLQTYENYEIIVIDDGSTDDSFSVAKQFLEADLNVESRVIHKENAGVSSARNRGILEAKYDYVALLDGDDLWEENYLEEQVKLIQDFSKAKMWGVNYAETYLGKMIRKVPTGLQEKYRGYIDNYFQIEGRVSDLFNSSAIVIKKDVFEQIEGFDERIRYAEDNDMWFRIIATNKVVFYDEYLVKYQQDTENRAMNKKWELKYFLPFYVDKFQQDIYKKNAFFYKWINCWCAIHLRRYYFSKYCYDVEQSKIAIKRLDYNVIPYKYRLLFKFPYCLSVLLNKFDNWYHNL